jgi:hypothetical protein
VHSIACKFVEKHVLYVLSGSKLLRLCVLPLFSETQSGQKQSPHHIRFFFSIPSFPEK